MGINNQFNYYDSSKEHSGMNFRRFPNASGIYKITNTVNEKVYVGLAVNLKLRCKAHRVELRANKHKNSHLQRAWNLYGEQSFEFQVLEICTVAMLTEQEDYWCKILSAHNRDKGYNIQTTGIERRNCSEETKNKIAKANKGKRYFGEKNPFFGKHHDQETINRILSNRDSSQMAKMAWETKREKGFVSNSSLRKKVINQETGKIYDSVSAAARTINHTSSQLCRKLSGKTKNNTSFKYFKENGL